MRTMNYNLSALLGLVFLVIFSCKEDKPDPEPVLSLTKISGDNQVGFGGTPLSHPLKVKVVGQDGAPDANRTVEFNVVTGKGTLSTNQVTTDHNGEAQIIWTLDSNTPEQTVKAFLVGSEVVFSAKLKVITLTNYINWPFCVFVGANGNVYATNYKNDRVQMWVPGTLSGIIVAGGNGDGNAANQFYNPQGIFVDASGNIFVADAGNNRIQKWAPGATSGVTVAGGNGPGSAANQLVNPVGVFVDPNGNIYVADQLNNRIQKWLP
jgi:archaellum component FlaF (FlaF/FlaG flagellin family)